MQLGIDGSQPHTHFRVAVNKTVGFNNGQVHVHVDVSVCVCVCVRVCVLAMWPK